MLPERSEDLRELIPSVTEFPIFIFYFSDFTNFKKFAVFFAKRHFRWYVTEIDRSVCCLLLFVRSPKSAFRPLKYRLAEATVGFGGPAKK